MHGSNKRGGGLKLNDPGALSLQPEVQEGGKLGFISGTVCKGNARANMLADIYFRFRGKQGRFVVSAIFLCCSCPCRWQIGRLSFFSIFLFFQQNRFFSRWRHAIIDAGRCVRKLHWCARFTHRNTGNDLSKLSTCELGRRAHWEIGTLFVLGPVTGQLIFTAPPFIIGNEKLPIRNNSQFEIAGIEMNGTVLVEWHFKVTVSI